MKRKIALFLAASIAALGLLQFTNPVRTNPPAARDLLTVAPPSPAIAAVQPLQLSAGAGLWVGPVVEGFFGAQAAQIHDVIGDTVNTAKRLCDHAQPGQLLSGPIAQGADSGAAQVSILAKGKAHPIIASVYPAL